MHHGTHVQDPNYVMERTFLDGETYAKALESFIIVCVDAIICDRDRRTFFLALRTRKPAGGWWCIGGRRFAGEERAAAMRRVFTRETALELDADRFRLISMYEHRWSERQQEPQTKGVHDLSFTHVIDLTADERRRVSENLDANEYDAAIGLREFDRDRLARESTYPKKYLELYDVAFAIR